MNTKMKIIIALLTGLVISGVIYANSIVGSKHDLTSTGPNAAWGLAGGICEFCHVPHNSTVTDAPLWNHALSGATFTPYASNTIDVDGGTIGAPAGISQACFGCHDGVTNLDDYGAVAGTMVMPAGNGLLGTDLGNDHPISMTYDPAADTALHATTNTFPTTAITVASVLRGAADDQVECSSCHEPHDNVNGKFLRISNAASELCRGCHNK